MKIHEISSYFQYFKLRPVFGYYKVFISFFLYTILKPIERNKYKLHSTKIMIIKFKGIKGIVRPQHEDLLYYSGAAKMATDSWFKPRTGENIIDVGSNVGRYSLIGAKKGANVISIEANPDTFDLLYENCKINEFRNIRAINVAVSNRTGKLILSCVEGHDGLASVERNWVESYGIREVTTKVEVKSEKLDNLHSFDKVDWLLIDVEGHEIEVLESALYTLSLTRRIIIEVEPERKERVMKILDGFVIVKEAASSGPNSYLFLMKKE